MHDLSVVIVSFNTRDLLAVCLDHLIASLPEFDTQVIVVDNGSSDGSPDLVRECYPSVNLIESHQNLGFAGANNRGIRAADAPFVLLLNSDAFINSDAISSALRVLANQPDVGMVGVKILNPDGSVQANDGKFPNFWTDVAVSLGINRIRVSRRRQDVQAIRNAEWVHGACLFARSAAIAQTGMLDESFFMYSEEVEWCFRFWQHGWRVVFCGEASVIHLGGSSSSNNDLGRRFWLYRSRLGLRRRMAGRLSSALLWALVVIGFGLRIPAQFAIRLFSVRSNHSHGPQDDWQLLRQILKMDPLSNWARSD